MSSRFRAAVDSAPVGVAVVGLDGRLELVNQRLRDLFQLSGTEGDVQFLSYYAPEDHAEVIDNVSDLLSGEQDHLVKERRLVRPDGSRVWCRVFSSTLTDADGNVTGIVAHVLDIEAERAAAEELRSKTRWFSSIVERASDLITLFDNEGTVTWVSPSVGAVLGREPAELLGMSILDLIHPQDRQRVLDAIEELTSGGQPRVEYRVPHEDGTWVWLETTASDLLADPDVNAVISISRDVTERHQLTEVLAHRASHDQLTGLANRAELEHFLTLALASAARSGTSLTIAYLDLDGFKEVNDSWGHPVGDGLLKAVAAALREQVRDGDLIARMGGDEFVVVLPTVGLPAAVHTAERIRARLSEPFVVDGVASPLKVSASIGLAEARGHETVTDLLRHADSALYAAKRRGRDRVEVPDAQIERLAMPSAT